MAQIYYFNKKEDDKILTEKDLMKLFISYKYNDKEMILFNINDLAQSLSKTSKLGRFGLLFRGIEIQEKEGKEYVDIIPALEELQDEGKIKIDQSNFEYFMILMTPEIENFKKEYSKKINDKFMDSLFFATHDLKYGLDGWELCFEDEYLKIPGYPGIITGEFIDQEKTPEVKVQIKKRCQERLKRM